MTSLCPSQHSLPDRLCAEFPFGHTFVIEASPGLGKTTLLREIHRRRGGVFLSVKDFPETMRSRHPLALEEAFGEWVTQALALTDCVLLDDLDVFRNVVDGCGHYPRSGILAMVLAALVGRAAEAGSRSVLTNGRSTPPGVRPRARSSRLHELTVDDHAFLLTNLLGRDKTSLDVARIHRFAPALNVHQLKAVCAELSRRDAL